ncbi:MAG: ABC transporter permease [Myxococcota bacterium]
MTAPSTQSPDDTRQPAVTHLKGSLDRETVGALYARLSKETGGVCLDMSDVDSVDSAGVALLSRLDRDLRAHGRRLEVRGMSPAVRQTLRIFPAGYTEPTAPSVRRASSFSWAVFMEVMRLCADTLFFVFEAFRAPRKLRWSSFGYELSQMGAGAFAVVGTIMYLIGATLALLSAAQLRQFGASLFVADLVGISVVKEIGPLMTAIAVAGRSGSAVAAEIGTMVITEEVDALRIMGIHPVRFLVVPKVLAILVAMPLLTIYGMLFGILGGLTVSISYLDIAVDPYLNRVSTAVLLGDFVGGMVKSFVFAVLIIIVGAWCGFATSGGSDAVGRSTTRSVVNSIFAIIAADAIANIILVLV